MHLGWNQNFGVEAQNNAGDNESEKMMAQLMMILGKDVNNVRTFVVEKCHLECKFSRRKSARRYARWCERMAALRM